MNENIEKYKKLMVDRATEGRCVYCGVSLAPDVLVNHGRICKECLPPDIVLRLSDDTTLSIPLRSRTRGRKDDERDERIKSSYWLLEDLFGSYPLIGLRKKR